jgi:putative ABC transport system permease protein
MHLRRITPWQPACGFSGLMFTDTLRFALRKIRRKPGASSVVALTLCAGIAVSAVIFSVSWAILFRPLPFRDQDRLVQLWANDARGNIVKLELSAQEIEALAAGKSFEQLAALSAANFPIVVSDRGRPLHFRSNMVGRGFYDMLGIRPLLGRGFSDADHKDGAPYVLLLSYDAWQRDFGGNRRAVGAKVSFDATTSAEVVGVLPRNLDLPAGVDAIIPIQASSAPDANRVLTAIGRLRPGVTIEQAAAEARTVAVRVREQYKEQDSNGITILVYPLVDEILGGTRNAIRIMLLMGMLVLLIALINVAAIALVQGIGSASELGVQSSVGGTRGRIALRRFGEALVLTTSAAAVAVVLANLLLKALLRIAPETIPRIREVALGPETIVFALAVAIIAAAVAAIVQTFSVSEDDMLNALRASAKSTSTRRARRILEVLAASQIAVAILTLVVASLLVQSFRKYASIDVGFTRRDAITFHLPMGYSMNPDPPAKRAFFDQLLARIRAVPGVTAAGSALMRPLELEQGWDMPFTADGQTAAQQEANPVASLLSVTPGYFEAMGIATLNGRTFDRRDRTDAQPVAIVSESLARRFWGVQSAVGKRIKGGGVGSEKPWLTIVGVVSDVRDRGITMEKAGVYVPFTQSNWSPNYFAVRTSVDPATVIPAIRALVVQADPTVPLVAIRTTGELVDAKLAQPRLSAAIVTMFAVTAAFLALIGLYGVLAFSVTARTREIGIRMALGAPSGSIVRMLVRRGLSIALAGTALGMLLGLLGDRLWQSWVWGVDGLDLGVLALLALLFGIAALVASTLPATRASNINPVEALRAE